MCGCRGQFSNIFTNVIGHSLRVALVACSPILLKFSDNWFPGAHPQRMRISREGQEEQTPFLPLLLAANLPARSKYASSVWARDHQVGWGLLPRVSYSFQGKNTYTLFWGDNWCHLRLWEIPSHGEFSEFEFLIKCMVVIVPTHPPWSSG